MNATDGTGATTDEPSDRPFDTPSFIINMKLLGVCFFLLNIALIAIYFCSFTLFVADDQNSFGFAAFNCKSRRRSSGEVVDNY